MKIKHSIQVLAAIVTIFFSSCATLTEEITIKEDGSGEYKVYTDMVPMMKNMIGGMMSVMQADGVAKDSVAMAKEIEERIWKDFGTEVDSVLDFSSKIPDEIKNNPKEKELISRVKGFMKGTRADGHIYTGMTFDFKNGADLQHLLTLTEESQQKENNFALGKSKSTVVLSKSAFSRTTKYAKRPDFDKDSETKMLLTMIGDMKIKTIVHLPKTPKKVTGQHVVKNEGNIVEFEYTFIETLNGKSSTDFSIEY